GIESFIKLIYENNSSFIDYFNNPTVLLDETVRIVSRIRSFNEEFQEIFKTMIEKGEVLPIQAEWVYDIEYILNKIKNTTRMLIKKMEDNHLP
ncbi:MAG: hypothetical protein N2169_08085, partial [bacterium]|nr:hypothetical protein [bacterium]